MAIIEAESDGVWLRLRVKAVPGARREGIAGVLGDRLKVRVSQPPEGGRANQAICEVVRAALGSKAARVEIAAGAASAEKVLRISGMEEERVRAALGIGERRGADE